MAYVLNNARKGYLFDFLSRKYNQTFNYTWIFVKLLAVRTSKVGVHARDTYTHTLSPGSQMALQLCSVDVHNSTIIVIGFSSKAISKQFQKTFTNYKKIPAIGINGLESYRLFRTSVLFQNASLTICAKKSFMFKKSAPDVVALGVSRLRELFWQLDGR